MVMFSFSFILVADWMLLFDAVTRQDGCAHRAGETAQLCAFKYKIKRFICGCKTVLGSVVLRIS